ncbi:AbrB/MazE/SpoVT family DNA-binding domain-containing protein [Candidatus Bathyarchaeota archaeon]|nr:AbrB/MazE/SpoVT family DNA-binding domain-containing protein [Candidatus Bathyarchaeota archaeon]
MKEEIVTISAKGQIVLPSAIRRELSLEKGTKMVLVVKKGMVIMKPLKRLSELRGILSEIEKPAREIVKELREEWETKLGELT